MTADAADAGAPFRHRLRVYWEDTDAAGIVFYANYLKFFERARTEWLRRLGFEQERLRASEGIAFVVTDTSLRHHLPARLDDVLDITVRAERVGAASLTIVQEAWRDECVLASGRVRVGCVDLGTFKPRRMPAEVFDAIDRTSRTDLSVDPFASVPPRRYPAVNPSR